VWRWIVEVGDSEEETLSTETVGEEEEGETENESLQ